MNELQDVDVAFVSLHPEYSGVNTWTQTLFKAAKDCGSRSNAIAYSPRSPEERRRASALRYIPIDAASMLIDVLNSYDFVIFSEPFHGGQGDDSAWQLLNLRLDGLRTPYTTMYHGKNMAIDKPWTWELLKHKAYAGKVFATDTSWIPDEHKKSVIEMPYLPFDFKQHNTNAFGDRIVTTGRVDKTKGQMVAADAAKSVGIGVEIWGKDFGSEKARIYKEMIGRGWTPTVEYVRGGSNWGVSSEQLNIDYLGIYQPEDVDSIMTHAKVWSGMTDSKLVWGHLEYTALEAIDSLVPVVVPAVQVRGNGADEHRHIGLCFNYVNQRRYNRDEYISRLKEQLDLGESERIWQRATLARLHNPKTYLLRMIKECLG